MPSIAQFATPVGLVLFTYAFALMISASSPSEAETQPAFTVVPATAVDPHAPGTRMLAPPVEMAGTVVAGKYTDRLVPLRAALIAQAAEVDRRNGPADKARPAGPPPEAITACETVNDSQTCTFAGPEGDAVHGTCRAGPRGKPAACAPADDSSPHRPG